MEREREWVELVDADAVAPGQVVDGEPCVMEARCPHEWSHLGAEGVVDGDEIVCTAHFWRFDGDGCGTKLNVKGRRDPKADIAVFECRENAGRIEAWIEPAP